MSLKTVLAIDFICGGKISKDGVHRKENETLFQWKNIQAGCCTGFIINLAGRRLHQQHMPTSFLIMSGEPQ